MLTRKVCKSLGQGIKNSVVVGNNGSLFRRNLACQSLVDFTEKVRDSPTNVYDKFFLIRMTSINSNVVYVDVEPNGWETRDELVSDVKYINLDEGSGKSAASNDPSKGEPTIRDHARTRDDSLRRIRSKSALDDGQTEPTPLALNNNPGAIEVLAELGAAP